MIGSMGVRKGWHMWAAGATNFERDIMHAPLRTHLQDELEASDASRGVLREGARVLARSSVDEAEHAARRVEERQREAPCNAWSMGVRV